MQHHEQKSMLVVDDVEMNRAMLREIFRAEYRVFEAEDGASALELIAEPPQELSVVLLDLVMPGMDGVNTLKEMTRRGLLESVPVVVILAREEIEYETQVLTLGAADIIQKPFVPDVIFRRVQNVVDATQNRRNLEKVASDLAQRLQRSNESMVSTLSGIIEHRSMESGSHIMRIRAFTRVLLEEVAKRGTQYDLNPDAIGLIASASTLHDIGKIVIPDAILNKPGRLTPDEMAVMRTHAAEGGRIVMQFDAIQRPDYLHFAYDIARHHHERWDGRGYPDGLKGNQIPICAQVVGVADVYDALTTPRVYKPAYPHERAMEMILGGECGMFSDALMDCLRVVAPTFERLAQEYRDGGLSHNGDDYERRAPDSVAMLDDGLGYDQQKYHTALRFVDGVVLELDFDRGSYHVAYPTRNIFPLLPRDGNMHDYFVTIVEEYVHPEDRESISAQIRHFSDEILLGSMAKGATPCRVYIPEFKGYRWYNVRYHRIDMHNRLKHRALLVLENVHERVCMQVELQRRLGESAAMQAMRDAIDPEHELREALMSLHRYYGDTLCIVDLKEQLARFFPESGAERVETTRELISEIPVAVYRDDQRLFAEHVALLLRGADAGEIRYRRRTDANEYVWVRERCYTMRDEYGNAERVIVCAQTEDKGGIAHA